MDDRAWEMLNRPVSGNGLTLLSGTPGDSGGEGHESEGEGHESEGTFSSHLQAGVITRLRVLTGVEVVGRGSD